MRVISTKTLLNTCSLHSPKLSSLHPVTQQRDTPTPLQVVCYVYGHFNYSLSRVLAQFKENVGHIFVDSTPLVKLPEVNTLLDK